MSLKLFLPVFIALYEFGQTTFDLLFVKTLREVLESWISLDFGIFDALFDTAFNAIINAFPDLIETTPILFLLTSGITIVIIFNCVKFFVDLIP